MSHHSFLRSQIYAVLIRIWVVSSLPVYKRMTAESVFRYLHPYQDCLEWQWALSFQLIYLCSSPTYFPLLCYLGWR